ncbi:hypothetical protein D3C80_1325050 [compost metagenome]
MAAVLVRHPGDRSPGNRRGEIGCHRATGAFTQAQAVAVGAQGRQGQVFMAGGCTREQRLAPFDIVGKTTGSQYHGLACIDRDQATGCFDFGTGHPAVVAQQAFGRS